MYEPHIHICGIKGDPSDTHMCVPLRGTPLKPSVCSTGESTHTPVCDVLKRPNSNLFVYSTWGDTGPGP